MFKVKRIWITGSFLVFLSLVILFRFYLEFHYEVPILNYHAIEEKDVPGYPTVKPEVFFKQMQFIKKYNYRVISLKEYCQLLRKGKFPQRKSVVITFDDGLKDNLKAIAVLKGFDFPATIFLIVESLGGKKYLSKQDIEKILKETKIELGSHSWRHLYLPSLKEEELRKEIFGSKETLEDLFGVPLETFAYPAGTFNSKALEEVVSAGYLCACTTNMGFSKELNLFALRRTKITNNDLGFKLAVKLSGFYNFFKRPGKPF